MSNHVHVFTRVEKHYLSEVCRREVECYCGVKKFEVINSIDDKELFYDAERHFQELEDSVKREEAALEFHEKNVDRTITFSWCFATLVVVWAVLFWVFKA